MGNVGKTFYEINRQTNPKGSHPADAYLKNTCSNQVEQVITTLVLSALLLAGFQVTIIGRF